MFPDERLPDAYSGDETKPGGGPERCPNCWVEGRTDRDWCKGCGRTGQVPILCDEAEVRRRVALFEPLAIKWPKKFGSMRLVVLAARTQEVDPEVIAWLMGSLVESRFAPWDRTIVSKAVELHRDAATKMAVMENLNNERRRRQ